MKKIIITLLLTIPLAQAGFWTHIWNNTSKPLFITALEKQPKKTKLVTVKGYEPTSILPGAISSYFALAEAVVLPKKGKRFGFFENDFFLIPPNIKSDKKQYQSGNYVGGTIEALLLTSKSKTFIVKPTTYNFKNRYLEIQETRGGRLKLRWYFGFNKGPWKEITGR